MYLILTPKVFLVDFLLLYLLIDIVLILVRALSETSEAIRSSIQGTRYCLENFIEGKKISTEKFGKRKTETYALKKWTFDCSS